MNDILLGRWHELKARLKQRWGKLTEDDIAKMSGKQDELIHALRRRYGYGEGQALMEVQRWISDFDRDYGRPHRVDAAVTQYRRSGMKG